ncbi:hypothetical protein PROFUN_10088 [Planoprotostelium fungivorum]|uniref:Uncharacterized protein n=1 Tax=Planoprotostelium fungivorum TaxID=1890364 RepID=A0A2P6NF00_9EUKA|nr:hypothetical protein PROFUN_10088 [Planoprotostelium fungivorum]
MTKDGRVIEDGSPVMDARFNSRIDPEETRQKDFHFWGGGTEGGEGRNSGISTGTVHVMMTLADKIMSVEPQSLRGRLLLDGKLCKVIPRNRRERIDEQGKEEGSHFHKNILL